MKAFLIVLAVVVVGGAGYFIYRQKMMPAVTPVMKEDKMMADDATMEGSTYVEYEDGVLKQYADQKRVLFFYANWCPTCRPADQEFKAEVDQIPADVTLIRVNYNDSDTDANEEALANQYDVTYQHTFVQIDPSGDEIAKWNGGGMDELLGNII